MTTTQTRFAVRALPVHAHFADRMRTAEVDDFGHRIERIETGGPCRSCLDIAAPGEELLLVSYQPLADTSPYAEVGPIFIHRDSCTPFSGTFPEAFSERPLILRAYDLRGWISDATVAPPGEAQAAAAAFLARPEIAEVHVRHTSYTCFDFKMVRSS